MEVYCSRCNMFRSFRRPVRLLLHASAEANCRVVTERHKLIDQTHLVAILRCVREALHRSSHDVFIGCRQASRRRRLNVAG